MVKKEDSVRTLGQASIGTDIPTRDKIKDIAAKAGIPVSEFLRRVADNAADNMQRGLPLLTPPRTVDSQRQIESFVSRAIAMSKCIPMTDKRHLAILDYANQIAAMNELAPAKLLCDVMVKEFEPVVAKYMAKERGQLELELGLKESPV